MKKNMLWIALAALLAPIILRGLWFYRGFVNRPEIATPDYQALTISQLPLQTPEEDKEIEQTNGVVLLDFAHGNQYQSSEVRSLTEAIEKRGGRIETLTDVTQGVTQLESKLKYAKTYIVISPSVTFNALEVGAVQSFVERGGRLLVFADATRGLVMYDFFSGSPIGGSSDANAVNPLLAPFEISINNDYLYNVEENEGNFRNVFFGDFGKAELTFGLKQVALYGTHSIKTNSGLILLRGTESTLSSTDDTYDPAEGGAALSENGNVIAFGDFTFLTPQSHTVADHSTLIANLADFALGGAQTTTLANFPYIFSQSVVKVYPSSDVKLTAETVSALSKLQLSLRLVNASAEITNEVPQEGDVIILGTFTSSDDLVNLIEPFDIDLDDSEFIAVPNFGDVGRFGNGILLFKQNENGNTLILLADTPEDLISLISTVSSGSLFGCVLQGTTGICSVGFGGSYSDESSEGEFGEATEEPTSEEVSPTPTAIETPSG